MRLESIKEERSCYKIYVNKTWVGMIGKFYDSWQASLVDGRGRCLDYNVTAPTRRQALADFEKLYLSSDQCL